MRLTTSLALVVLFVPTVAIADAPRALPQLAKSTLSPSKSLHASEVAEQMRFYTTDINECYLTATRDVKGAGKLEIKLEIHRTGKLDAIDVTTPGLSARTSKRVADCVKAIVTDTAFPERKAPTTAIVPFFYQHTAAPNSGPQLSCWNPRGCK
jgi:hypothetical protein